MKKAALTLVAVLLVFLVPGFSSAADEPKVQKMTGEFKWNRMDEPGELKAFFKPTGENTWDVAFYFEFRDEPHIYRGTAEGSLKQGTLKGNVMTDGDEPSPFTFEGTVKDGKFEGTHASMREEEPQETGTLSLSH